MADLDALITTLASDDPDARKQAADALAAMDDPAAVDALIAALDHDFRDGQINAAEALVKQMNRVQRLR